MKDLFYIANCAIAANTAQQQTQAVELANKLHLQVAELNTQTVPCLLVVTEERLELRLTSADAPGPVYVDFVHGALAYRREHGGGRKQLIAKAVGLKKYKNPTVLDLTAGLGRDAFILANLGCKVKMLERSPVVTALLADGLHRAKQQAWMQQIDLVLIEDDARNYLTNLEKTNYPDVIYLDPMFPEKAKSALVKKEMRVLRYVVGGDEDAPELLKISLQIAKKRVVVKRARLAPALAGLEPNLILRGKSSRFDIYTNVKDGCGFATM